jgi:peptide/nickel transport system ATP-binding protein
LPSCAHCRIADELGASRFDGIDILSATEAQMCALRGDDIGMVFQEPMTALNPVKTIGEQVAEGIRWHTRASRAEAEAQARKILDRVGLPERRNSRCRAIRTNCPAASGSASSSPSPAR